MPTKRGKILAYFSQKELAVTPTEFQEIEGLFQGQMATNGPKMADLTPNSLQEIPATTSHGGGGGCILRKILDMSSAGFSPGNPSGQPAPDTSEAFSEPLLGQFSVPKPENLAAIEFGEEVPATTSPGGRGGYFGEISGHGPNILSKSQKRHQAVTYENASSECVLDQFSDPGGVNKVPQGSILEKIIPQAMRQLPQFWNF